MTDTLMTIGQLAQRAGLATSALRYYEDQGLLGSARTGSGHRQFERGTLRRVAFIRAAQAVGLSLEEIRAALATLPEARTPTAADWQRLSRQWQPMLDARIAALMQLRDQLSACIGCGCLSLTKCKLYNPQDAAATLGAGPRYLMGDRAADVMDAAPAAAQKARKPPQPPRPSGSAGFKRR